MKKRSDNIKEFLNRGDKIWWEFKNTRNYPSIPIIKVDSTNFKNFTKEVQESIDCFLSELEWDEMWTLDNSQDRIDNGMILFLLRDTKGALGHTWFNGNQWFNWYVHKRREQGISLKFILSCWNQIEHSRIICWAEPWNVAPQKGFEKLGGKIFNNK